MAADQPSIATKSPPTTTAKVKQDYQVLPTTSQALIYAAMVRLLLRRLP